jgi:hypothetical protein
VYAINKKEEELIKIKGLNKQAISENKITRSFLRDSLENLLNKDYKLSFKQNKWFKNINQANIQVLEQIYTLKATNSKRELVYNDEDVLTGTTHTLLKVKLKAPPTKYNILFLWSHFLY